MIYTKQLLKIRELKTKLNNVNNDIDLHLSIWNRCKKTYQGKFLLSIKKKSFKDFQELDKKRQKIESELRKLINKINK